MIMKCGTWNIFLPVEYLLLSHPITCFCRKPLWLSEYFLRWPRNILQTSVCNLPEFIHKHFVSAPEWSYPAEELPWYLHLLMALFPSEFRLLATIESKVLRNVTPVFCMQSATEAVSEVTICMKSTSYKYPRFWHLSMWITREGRMKEHLHFLFSGAGFGQLYLQKNRWKILTWNVISELSALLWESHSG